MNKIENREKKINESKSVLQKLIKLKKLRKKDDLLLKSEVKVGTLLLDLEK